MRIFPVFPLPSGASSLRQRCVTGPASLLFFLCCGLGYGQTASSPTEAAKRSGSDFDITIYQGKIAEDPGFFGNYERLTYAYIRKARETGDISYYDLAEQTLATEEKKTHPTKATLLNLKATIHYAKHEFAEAAAESEESVKAQGGSDAAYATVGDAHLEQGEYDKALAAFSKLAAYPDDFKHSLLRYDYMTRIAHYKFIEGDGPGSIADLRGANKIAAHIGVGKEAKAWTQFILSEELFLAGDLTGAEAADKASLEFFPTYHRALSEMGRIRAAQGKYAEAIDDYKQAIAIIPLPIYVAALGDLYTRSGAKAEAEKQYALVEFIGKLSALNRQVYNRELALFYADHDRKLREALQLARAELKVRHDVYTWDTLAWALYKNGLGAEAMEAAHNAMLLKTPDSVIYFHSGLIYEKFGNKQQGREYLKEALALNPQFHPLFADQARKVLAADSGDRTKSAPAKTAIRRQSDEGKAL